MKGIIAMSFNIGENVRVKNTGEFGVIIDRMHSEARQKYIYVITLDDSTETITQDEDAIELFRRPKEYKIDAQIADNVVIAIIYEVEGGKKYEVCRGHGHIIHDGAEGIAQALAYASKQAFIEIDSGIYMKQRRK